MKESSLIFINACNIYIYIYLKTVKRRKKAKNKILKRKKNKSTVVSLRYLGKLGEQREA